MSATPIGQQPFHSSLIMLNATLIRGNNQYAAAHYFSSADDYYSKENPGQWQGIGAIALELNGSIEPGQFARLLNGQLPNGQHIYTTFDTTDKKKRMALDLTFSAPKSVSMQALIAGDHAVTAAHDYAVTKALDQVEKLAESRKKIQGKSTRQRTGNLVVAKFRHEMSRAKDPQLHTHAVVLNMTQRTDGAWRALCNEDIFRVQHQIDAIYKAELAAQLQRLGYAIRLVDDKGAFELAHISRAQITAFSERSRVIEDALANEGKTRASATSLEKQVIALATRARKDEQDRNVIKRYWVEKSSDLGIDFGSRSNIEGNQYGPDKTFSAKDTAVTVNKEAASLPAHLTPAQAVVQYAINHLTEREAVVSEHALMTAAIRRAVGLANYGEIQQEIKRLTKQGTLIESAPAYRTADGSSVISLSKEGWKAQLQAIRGCSRDRAAAYVEHAIQRGSLVLSEKRYTTQKALKREQVILSIERTGRGSVTSILTAEKVHEVLAQSTLNAGQKLAVETIVSTQNRFVGIQGDAGTGKTYSVNQAVALVNGVNALAKPDLPSAGFHTIALAPYGNQVKALKSEGLEAHTLASFLHTKQKPINDKTIVLLDEAAVVGSRQMEQVMRIVEKSGARMVMLGDTKQTEAIEAGKPFAQLQTNGMQTARISEIQRQQNPELKMAVAFAAEGQVADSLNHVSHVEELQDAQLRHQTIATDYVMLDPAARRDTLIVVGTNAARHEINRMVREELKLAGKGREFDTLIRVDMTQAQRRFAPSYEPGMIIQPDKDYSKCGLKRGETYAVIEALPGNRLTVKNVDGVTTEINPRRVTQLSVYHAVRAELSVGDMIRINRNDSEMNLTNGDRMRIAGIFGGFVTLEVLDKQSGLPVRSFELLSNKPLHLEHAYVSTVHSSQGLTSSRSFISIDTSSRTTSICIRSEGRACRVRLAPSGSASASIINWPVATAPEIWSRILADWPW